MTNQNKSDKSNFWIKIVFFIAGVYMLIIFLNFLSNRSIWLDEAFLALNIKENSFRELFFPLKYGQVAPIGYLLFEKFMGNLLGYKDWVLRIYSLFTLIGSVYLFYKLLEILFKDKLFATFSVAFLISLKPVIYYSAEIKQYMGDMFWVLALWYAYLVYAASPSRKKLYLLTVTGVMSVWFSNVSVIAMFCIAVYHFLFEWRAKAGNNKQLMNSFLLWIISFGIYTYFFILGHPTKSSMLNYWKKHFFPLNITNPSSYEFVYTHIKDMFKIFFEFPHWHFFFIFLLIGLFMLIKDKKYKVIYIISSIFILHLILSGFKLYPFYFRLILYSIPFLIIPIAYFYYSLFKIVLKFNDVLAAIILFIPFLESFFVLKKQFPLKHQEIKVALAHINKNIKPNQQVYVYYASQYAFNFYKNDYPNIKPEQIIYGVRRYANNKDFREDIPKLKDDVWLIFTHIEYSNKGISDYDNIMNLVVKHSHYKILEKLMFPGGILVHVIKNKKGVESKENE